MAATSTADRFLSEHAVKLYDFDPNATTVTAVAWVPLALFSRFVACFFRTIGTSAVTFDIAVASDSSGTGAAAVKAHAVGSQPDAVGDQIFLEVSAEQCKEVLATGTHVSARVSFATNTDEGVVAYIRTDPRHQYSGLTADVIA
jgi:hypothetical protein